MAKRPEAAHQCLQRHGVGIATASRQVLAARLAVDLEACGLRVAQRGLRERAQPRGRCARQRLALLIQPRVRACHAVRLQSALHPALPGTLAQGRQVLDVLANVWVWSPACHARPTFSHTTARQQTQRHLPGAWRTCERRVAAAAGRGGRRLGARRGRSRKRSRRMRTQRGRKVLQREAQRVRAQRCGAAQRGLRRRQRPGTPRQAVRHSLSDQAAGKPGAARRRTCAATEKQSRLPGAAGRGGSRQSRSAGPPGSATQPAGPRLLRRPEPPFIAQEEGLSACLPCCVDMAEHFLRPLSRLFNVCPSRLQGLQAQQSVDSTAAESTQWRCCPLDVQSGQKSTCVRCVTGATASCRSAKRAV